MFQEEFLFYIAEGKKLYFYNIYVKILNIKYKTMESTNSLTTQLTRLHWGIWGTLENNTKLPVGGSIFSHELTIDLLLDYDSFESLPQEKVSDLYTDRKDEFRKWFNDLPKIFSKSLDAETFFTLIMVQNGIKKRLNIPDTQERDAEKERNSKYHSNTTPPKLSDFKDATAFCAERAALAQYILQWLNIPSVYMSGITFFDDSEKSQSHSWIVLYPDSEKSLVWDIARPQEWLPNLYTVNGRISLDMFSRANNAYIKTQKLWKNSQRYFWVSDKPQLLSERFIPNIVASVDRILT